MAISTRIPLFSGFRMETHGYTIYAQAGDVVIIRANHIDLNMNPRLNLLGPQGYLVATAGEPGTGRAEIVSDPLMLDGIYTLVVSDYSGNGLGVYYLSVQSVNRPHNPKFLPYDNSIRDTLVQPSEMKVYQFGAQAGDMVNIQMIAVTGGFGPHVRLFDPEGDLITGASDNDYALISNRILPETGTYTIIATERVGDEVGEYFLILSQLPTDADDNQSSGMPGTFVLNQNHPNPFNPQTTIDFNLPRSSLMSIDVYNILGENICTLISRRLTPGPHSVVWDGRDANGAEVPSGVYFYRLQTEEFSQTRKMLLLK
jgi:hypothetical protein